jgi:hypothetical protein
MKTIHCKVTPMIVLLSIFFLATGFCNANDDIKLAPFKHLGVDINCGLASYREDLVVPLGFDGIGLSLAIVSSRQSEKNLFSTRVRFGLGYMQNKYDHEALVVVQDIRLAWVKKFTATQRYGEFWSGISLPLQMNNLFWGSWDDAHLYWLTAYSMGAALHWRKGFSGNEQARIRIEFPIINWISRPPKYRYTKQEPTASFSYHYSEPNKSFNFATLNTYQALFIQALWQKIKKRSLLNIGLEFQYNHYSEPERIWGFNTMLIFSYQWRIGS